MRMTSLTSKDKMKKFELFVMIYYTLDAYYEENVSEEINPLRIGDFSFIRRPHVPDPSAIWSSHGHLPGSTRYSCPPGGI